MANLAHAIHSLQSGELSHSEFLAQVDRLLASDRANSARLSELLDDQHTRIMLPAGVYAELQRRLEVLSMPRSGAASEDTVMHPQARDRSTAQRPNVPSPGATVQQSDGEPERVKGVGDTLNGRFVLEECIGFGGMGTVYKALDLRKLEASDRKPYIAIKVLNVQFRGHPKSLIALQREARKAQALAHPNIVAVYDFDRDGSMVYLTMEYLAGQPLSQSLRSEGFIGMPYDEAMRIVRGMGRALAYAHERGFVHCDFKPANVILTDAGEVKVIDFGIARIFRKPEEEADATVFDPGSLGALTPAYASPEMLEHREPDPRDDIYALGCITYELLTGRHPFNRLAATQAKAARMKPQRPDKLGNRQWRALKCALSFDRESRTPTVARFLDEMNSERGVGRHVALAGGSALAALLAAGIGYYYWQTPADKAAGPAPPPTESTVASAPASPAPGPAANPAPAPPLTLQAITPALAQVPCSALAASVQAHSVQVNGYLPDSFGSDRLSETLKAIPGVGQVNLEVLQVADNKCPVIDTFAPYWASNRQAASPATIRTKAADAVLREGEPLVVDVTTPAYDSYVYVDYYALDGSVVHMVPSPRIKGNQAPPNYAATIGGEGSWVVGKPFGTEMIVLLTSPVPLFDGLRPEHEDGSDYLQAVKERLRQLADKQGGGQIAVDFLQITTRKKAS